MFGLDDYLGGLGDVLGSAFGETAASYDQDRAQRAMEDALQAYKNVPAWDVGILSNQSQAGPSQLSNYQEDPQTRAAQLDALMELQEIHDSGGMTLGDRVAQEQAMNRSAQFSRGQTGAAIQSMAARGQLGGGAELAARLDAAQGANANAYNAGSQSAAAAQNRALEALISSGKVGGQIRSQDFSQAAQRAQAADTMARFNAAQRQSAYDTNWRERMAQAQGIAGADEGLAGYYSGQAQRTREYTRGLGKGIGGLVGDVGKAYAGGGSGGFKGFGGGGGGESWGSGDSPSAMDWYGGE